MGIDTAQVARAACAPPSVTRRADPTVGPIVCAGSAVEARVVDPIRMMPSLPEVLGRRVSGRGVGRPV